ncbi:MAG: family 43 glycosylhydrolase [Asticcacaulis sp.]
MMKMLRPVSGACRVALTLAAALCVSVSATAVQAQQTIENGVFWKDTSGTPIYSQGGGILQVGERYYWYGAKYEEAETYAQKPDPVPTNPHFSSVTVYSSTDLVNWRFEGDALKAGAAGQLLNRNAWLGRMGVVYNKQTRKYVLLTQYSDKTLGSGVLFATSDTPEGPFVFDNHQAQIGNVDARTSGDQTVFIDDDGQPYLIFSNLGGRRSLYVAPLRASDYLHIEPATKIADTPGGGREGNAMFKHNGLYYFGSSDLHGWNASRSYYMTSKSILGPYSSEKILAGTEADFSHVSQNGFFISVQGSEQTTVLYAGDRWSNFAANGHGYNIWVPLSFDGETPRFNSLSQFTFDVAKGTWAVGPQNNYILNPGFEADRVTQANLVGWFSSWTNLKGSGPIANVLDGRTGRWALSLAHDGDTLGNAVQDVTLPDGTYRLKFWAKSSGGQGLAKVYAAGHGGAELAHYFSGSVDEWTEITIPDIKVTTGRVQIGVYAEGKEGQWLRLDDFSLVRQ